MPCFLGNLISILWPRKKTESSDEEMTGKYQNWKKTIMKETHRS
jgi:hypothetical protein